LTAGEHDARIRQRQLEQCFEVSLADDLTVNIADDATIQPSGSRIPMLTSEAIEPPDRSVQLL